MSVDHRVAFRLAGLNDDVRGEGDSNAFADADRRSVLAEQAVVHDEDGTAYVVIDTASVDGDGAALHADLTALGLIGGGSYGNAASGLLPVAALEALEGLPNLALAQPAMAIGNTAENPGEVVSQDVAALQADVARHLFGVDGSGVTIGILSDSFATAEDPLTTFEDDIAAGELPDVEILQDSSVPARDEGRAMAQLIHDIAPGADILFATAFEGAGSFAANIDALVEAGADIIVDDVSYVTEPMFQDGVIAQAAANAVAAGVPFFSSAGNAGTAGYEAPFRSTDVVGQRGGALHDWDPGPGVDPFLDIVVPAGSDATFILQWDDPFLSGDGTGPAGTSSPGATTDLDFGLLDGAGPEAGIIGGSENLNIGANPVEIIRVENTSDEDASATLAIENAEGPDPETMRIIGLDVPFDDFSLGYGVEYEEEFGTSTTFGHAVAEGVIGVGAADFFLTPEFGLADSAFPSDLTALGGSTILFDEDGQRLAHPDMRDAVDITASHRGNTTFFGRDLDEFPPIFPGGEPDADALPNFSGTSASAPNAAAVAALMLQAAPSLTPDGVEFLLEATAEDIVPDFSFVGADVLEFWTAEELEALSVGVARGPDARTGAGLINATAAVAATYIPGDDLVASVRLIEGIEDELAFLASSFAELDPFGLSGFDAASHANPFDRLDGLTDDLRLAADEVLDLLPDWLNRDDEFLA